MIPYYPLTGAYFHEGKTGGNYSFIAVPFKDGMHG
jgi:hypothetical protein